MQPIIRQYLCAADAGAAVTEKVEPEHIVLMHIFGEKAMRAEGFTGNKHGRAVDAVLAEQVLKIRRGGYYIVGTAFCSVFSGERIGRIAKRFTRGGKEPKLLGKLVRMPDIIAVKEGNIVPLCFVEPAVPGAGCSEVLFVCEKMHSFVPFAVLAHNIGCRIIGAVINNDELKALVRLRKRGINGFTDIAFGII